jgi:hypothetical protein
MVFVSGPRVLLRHMRSFSNAKIHNTKIDKSDLGDCIRGCAPNMEAHTHLCFSATQSIAAVTVASNTMALEIQLSMVYGASATVGLWEVAGTPD